MQHADPAFSTSRAQTVLQRLANRDEERQVQRQQRGEQLQGSDAARPQLDQIALDVARQEQAAAQAAYFLPAYDQRQVAVALAGLRQAVEGARKQAQGQRKFAFGRKANAKPAASGETAGPGQEPSNAPAEAMQTSDGLEQLLQERTGRVQGLHGQEVVVQPGQLRGRDFHLSNMQDCRIWLLGSMSALRLQRLQNCRVYSGPVSGATFIEEVQDCTLVLASHQVRVHASRSSDLYLRLRSTPVIERCSGLRFAPYRLRYEGSEAQLAACELAEDAGQWSRVQDFQWHRASQSPNWCILPEDERAEPPASLPGQ